LSQLVANPAQTDRRSLAHKGRATTCEHTAPPTAGLQTVFTALGERLDTVTIEYQARPSLSSAQRWMCVEMLAWPRPCSSYALKGASCGRRLLRSIFLVTVGWSLKSAVYSDVWYPAVWDKISVGSTRTTKHLPYKPLTRALGLLLEVRIALHKDERRPCGANSAIWPLWQNLQPCCAVDCANHVVLCVHALSLP
jgi:hypothetical protein